MQLISDEALASFAFNSMLRRYTPAYDVDAVKQAYGDGGKAGTHIYPLLGLT